MSHSSRTPRVPQLCLHKRSGRAFATFHGGLIERKSRTQLPRQSPAQRERLLLDTGTRSRSTSPPAPRGIAARVVEATGRVRRRSRPVDQDELVDSGNAEARGSEATATSSKRADAPCGREPAALRSASAGRPSAPSGGRPLASTLGVGCYRPVGRYPHPEGPLTTPFQARLWATQLTLKGPAGSVGAGEHDAGRARQAASEARCRRCF